jgi:hypothetical protein
MVALLIVLAVLAVGLVPVLGSLRAAVDEVFPE